MINHIIFSSFVYRIAGGAFRYDEYGQYLQQNGKREEKLPIGYCTPGPFGKDLEEFLGFVELYTKEDEGRMKSSFEGRQHPGHVPAGLKQFNTYRSFLQKFATECKENHLHREKFFDYKVGEGDGTPLTRELARKALKSSILCCLTGSDANADKTLECQLNFLAHEVLADVEELVSLPFGPVTCASIGSGSGGAHGAQLFVLKDPTLGKGGNTLEKKLSKIHNELVAHFLVEDVWILSMLGLQVTTQKRLKWRYHGREYCVTDTEHILCKLSIICKNTLQTKVT